MIPRKLTDGTEHRHQPSTAETEEADVAPTPSMSTEDIRESYARYAKWSARLDWINRLLTGRYRRRRFANAEGRVLDVACGTGTNFRYLPESVEIVGIDISEEMLRYARRELDVLDRKGTLVRMDAQSLEFETDSIDTVISSLSTCTFPDPILALQEMKRVCIPDGRVLLVEHGRSDVGFIARYQEWRADAHYAKAGCRVTQEPLEVVEQAGLTVNGIERGQFGRITSVAASPE